MVLRAGPWRLARGRGPGRGGQSDTTEVSSQSPQPRSAWLSGSRLTQHEDGTLGTAAALLLGADRAPRAVHQVLDLVRVLALAQDLGEEPGGARS